MAWVNKPLSFKMIATIPIPPPPDIPQTGVAAVLDTGEPVHWLRCPSLCVPSQIDRSSCIGGIIRYVTVQTYPGGEQSTSPPMLADT